LQDLSEPAVKVPENYYCEEDRLQWGTSK